MIIFSTPSVLDMKALLVMGMSAKEGDENIGMFGTGFKYATAQLIRTGHTINIYNNGELYKFGSVPHTSRGKDFSIVTLLNPNGTSENCGFTTELGKNWTTLQSFRELESNTRDEKGTTRQVSAEPFHAPASGVHIVVSGPEIDKAYAERGLIFLNPDYQTPKAPIFATNKTEIYLNETHNVYLKGVAVFEHKLPYRYTYNFRLDFPLTEDRTLKNIWMIEHLITALLENVVSNWNNVFATWDEYAETSGKSVGTIFVKESTAKALYEYKKRGGKCPPGTAEFLKSKGFEDEIQVKREFYALEKQRIEKAISLLMKMRLVPKPGIGYPIHLADVPNNIHAYADRKNSRILLSEDIFKYGTKYVASTIYEEYLHLEKLLDDQTRAMQNHLFETIFTVYEEATQELID